MSRHKTHLDPETGAPFHPLAPAQDAGASPVMARIDARLADLHEANETYRKSSWDRSDAIQRNEREIHWLREIRSELILEHRTPAGDAALEIESLKGAMRVLEEGYDRIKTERDHALALVENANVRPRNFLAWAVGMFGPVAKLRSERLMRFVEEAIELAHADGMERATFDAIASRVYGRERGEIRKEIGQAQACLETYAENIGESASALAEVEWQRVQRIPSDEWQRRHKAKQEIGIALSDTSTICNCGGDPGQPSSDHDISCPAAISTPPQVSQPE